MLTIRFTGLCDGETITLREIEFDGGDIVEYILEELESYFRLEKSKLFLHLPRGIELQWDGRTFFSLKGYSTFNLYQKLNQAYKSGGVYCEFNPIFGMLS